MTINSDVQAPVKLSVEEILEAILQLSSAEQTVLVLKLKRLGLYDSKPLPYVVKLEEGKSLEQILQERGYKGVNWARVDEIVKELDIQEPIEELLQTLNS